MSKTLVIKKASCKTICGNVRSMNDGELFKVYGRAVDVKGGESNFGPWECLKGDFLVTRTEDGQKFRSNTLFMPETAHEMVSLKLKDSDVKSTIEFAFGIGKQEDLTSATGYVYTVTPLIESEPESDPLEKMILQIESAKNQAKGAKKESKK